MADLSKGGRIRDPVHGYVLFTGLEREVINHPIAQRLRHISQSGMAQMVFPEVRSSRFSHSLGAMHLSSQFFAAALSGASDEARDKLEEAMREAVTKFAPLALAEQLEALMERMTRQGLRAGTAVADDFRVEALLVEQGLRLAALFHDLGHLPFSHDFEAAMDDLFRSVDEADIGDLEVLREENRLALHERIGFRLAHHLQLQVFKGLVEQADGKAVEVAFLIAEKILKASPPGKLAPSSPRDGLYQWLHSLIASELDVDRCDYILRDTRHYGFEFASYDLSRVVDNLVVVDLGDNRFRTAVRPQGQSAVESFLLARFRMYQWGVRHHKVVQVAAALRHVIGVQLRPALADANHSLRVFLNDLAAIVSSSDDFAKARPEVLERYAGYDDVWWTSYIRRAAADTNDPWLHLVCSRRPGPVSLWKRVPDFPDGDLAHWNLRLPGAGDDVGLSAWHEAQRELAERGVLVVRNAFEPWKPTDRNDPESDSELAIAHPTRGLVPLTTVSHLTKALRPAWRQDMQVFAFAAAENLITQEEVMDILPHDDSEEASNE